MPSVRYITKTPHLLLPIYDSSIFKIYFSDVDVPTTGQTVTPQTCHLHVQCVIATTVTLKPSVHYTVVPLNN